MRKININENTISACILALPLVGLFFALPATAYLWEQFPVLNSTGWFSVSSFGATLIVGYLIAFAAMRIINAVASSIASLFN